MICIPMLYQIKLQVHKNTHEVIERCLGNLGDDTGPTLVFTAGIHGNEPSGVLALQDAIGLLRAHNVKLQGQIIALAGNLKALKEGIRYENEDLNRVWTGARIEDLRISPEEDWNNEEREMHELHGYIRRILDRGKGPFYFIDLHTTSSQTSPFITINDALINRKFAEKFSVPIILGIEEYLEGPLLSYINELGYVACGFEAGQHDCPESYRNQLAFVIQSLAVCGIVSPADLPKFEELIAPIQSGAHQFYEIRFRYPVGLQEEFTMKPGFMNFEGIDTGEILATSNGEEVLAPSSGQIFMPLYQKQGDDGFFIIRPIHQWALKLSAWLRKIKVDSWLTVLPGVRRASDGIGLEVNLHVARFLARDFFHLLGYRSKYLKSGVMYTTNRERVARNKEYRNWL